MALAVNVVIPVFYLPFIEHFIGIKKAKSNSLSLIEGIHQILTENQYRVANLQPARRMVGTFR